MSSIKILPGDCRDVLATLPAASVQCVVTSPPYYGLRDYGTGQWEGGDAACSHVVARVTDRSRVQHDTYAPPSGWTNRDATPPRQCSCGATRIDRQIGLEPTPDEYLATMVAVFREVRRVLREDGTCWVNMGDSYAVQGGKRRDEAESAKNAERAALNGYDVGGWSGRTEHIQRSVNTAGNGYKPKDLLMMPARLAIALQADGWWLRSDIIWHKPNPMPESVTDRPTSAHEHVFLLTKRATYYYDADAVREAAEYGRGTDPTGRMFERVGNGIRSAEHINGGKGHTYEGGRNLRNVWTIATAPYAEAHFATFPPALAERCIKAGTSERGCCGQCGTPWGRVAERAVAFTSGSGKAGNVPNGKHAGGAQAVSGAYDIRMGPSVSSVTTGWAPGCRCDAPVVPCVVLDPFAGAGTTLLVADRLQRHAIGIELNPAYTEMAMARCVADAPLFTSWPPAEDPADTHMADLFAGHGS